MEQVFVFWGWILSLVEITAQKTTNLKLPHGWKQTELGNICHFKNGINFSSSQKGSGFLTVDVKNMYSDSLFVSMADLYRVETNISEDYLLQPQDILFVRSSVKAEGVGWATLFEGYSEDVSFCGFIIRARLFESEEVLPDFLIHYLRSKKVRDWIVTNSTTGTITNISQKVLQRLRIPIPPFEEQKRIVAILNDRLAAVDKARAAAEAQLEAAKALPAAYLRQIFDSPEAQTWPRKKLGEICSVSGGIQKTPQRSPQSFHRPYLTVRNVQRGYLDLSDIQEFEITQAELERCRLTSGDLLIVEGNGSEKHIGRNAIYRGELGECIHQNHLIRVRFQESKQSADFYSTYLNSPLGKAQMLEKAKTTTGLYTLSVSKIEKLEVPDIPIQLQHQIIEEFTDRSSPISQLQKSAQAQLDDINKIPAALLRQAFNGEL